MNEEDRGDNIQVSLIARRINSYKQIKITSKITNQKYHYHKQDDNGRIFDIAQ